MFLIYVITFFIFFYFFTIGVTSPHSSVSFNCPPQISKFTWNANTQIIELDSHLTQHTHLRSNSPARTHFAAPTLSGAHTHTHSLNGRLTWVSSSSTHNKSLSVSYSLSLTLSLSLALSFALSLFRSFSLSPHFLSISLSLSLHSFSPSLSLISYSVYYFLYCTATMFFTQNQCETQPYWQIG